MVNISEPENSHSCCTSHPKEVRKLEISPVKVESAEPHMNQHTPSQQYVVPPNVQAKSGTFFFKASYRDYRFHFSRFDRSMNRILLKRVKRHWIVQPVDFANARIREQKNESFWRCLRDAVPLCWFHRDWELSDREHAKRGDWDLPRCTAPVWSEL